MKTQTAKEIKERGASFTTDLVRAVLENRKTKTRRLGGLKDVQSALSFKPAFENENSVWWDALMNDKDGFYYKRVRCPYGKIGDVLYVQETYTPSFRRNQETNQLEVHTYKYKADLETQTLDGVRVLYGENTDKSKFKTLADLHKWKSGRFMPKVAARIFLKITNIRVERVCDISEADAVAEGVQGFEVDMGLGNECIESVSAKNVFQNLWSKINGADTWQNWCWIIEFEVIK